MARKRRKRRRSATRNTASLLALALPAPLQRLANSPVGPLLMFFGLPAMLVAGLLQVDWQNGTPQLTVNPSKASELGQAVQDRLGHLPGHATIEQWQQTARETWNSHAPQAPPQNHPTQPGQTFPAGPGSSAGNHPPHAWPSPYPRPHTAAPPQRGSVNPHTRAPFPSTKPPSYVSTTPSNQAAAAPPGTAQQQYSPSSQAAQQQPYPQPHHHPQQSPQYQQPQYQQPQYQQPQYQQQQPAFPAQSSPQMAW